MPAVSFKTKGISPILIVFSRTSLVVPATSLTMARSFFSRALKRVDFPAFVGPAITTLAPEVKTLTASKLSTAEERFLIQEPITETLSGIRLG